MWILQAVIAAALVACIPIDSSPDGPVDPIGAWPIPARLHAASDDPALLAAWAAELKLQVDDINFGISAIS